MYILTQKHGYTRFMYMRRERCSSGGALNVHTLSIDVILLTERLSPVRNVYNTTIWIDALGNFFLPLFTGYFHPKCALLYVVRNFNLAVSPSLALGGAREAGVRVAFRERSATACLFVCPLSPLSLCSPSPSHRRWPVAALLPAFAVLSAFLPL